MESGKRTKPGETLIERERERERKNREGKASKSLTAHGKTSDVEKCPLVLRTTEHRGLTCGGKGWNTNADTLRHDLSFSKRRYK